MSEHVTEAAFLVAFSDLTGFSRYARGRSDREIFDTMSAYAEMVGDVVEPAGGDVVKFIGDTALVIFPEDRADAGVRALLDLKDKGDAWLAARGLSCRHVIKAHFGPLARGPIGTRKEKRPDIYGLTVNTAAMTPSKGVALTPQAFRKLEPSTRKRLKKHTPPVTYIPAEEPHRD